MSNDSDESDDAHDLAPEGQAALAALTDRQRKLVLLVAQGVGQVEAGRQAGYAGKWVDSIVSRELRKPKLMRALEALLASGEGGGLVLDRPAVKRELSKIAVSGHASSRVRALEALDRIDARDKPAAMHPMRVLHEEIARAGGVDEWGVLLFEQQAELMERYSGAFVPNRPDLRARALAAVDRMAVFLRDAGAPPGRRTPP